MNVSPEIAARQAAYQARPFAVMWCDSHFSGCSRFNTLDEAYGYIADQWQQVQKRCAVKTNAGSWIASTLRQGYLETPEGRMPLSYVMLCADVSNRP